MISPLTILRGVLTRFLPGCVLGFIILYSFASLSAPVNVDWWLAAGQVAVVALGFALPLVLLRHRLMSSAGVARRQSFIAGILGVPAAFIAMLFLGLEGVGPVVIASALAGMTLSIAMFFPWLKSPATLALTDGELERLAARKGNEPMTRSARDTERE